MTAESQGLVLLSRLHSALQMADPKTAPLLRFLFLQTLQPVVSALWQWLCCLNAQVGQVIIVDWPGGQAPLLTTNAPHDNGTGHVNRTVLSSTLTHLMRWVGADQLASLMRRRPRHHYHRSWHHCSARPSRRAASCAYCTACLRQEHSPKSSSISRTDQQQQQLRCPPAMHGQVRTNLPLRTALHPSICGAKTLSIVLSTSACCAVAECSLESTHDCWNRRGQQGAGHPDSVAYPLAFQTDVLRKVRLKISVQSKVLLQDDKRSGVVTMFCSWCGFRMRQQPSKLLLSVSCCKRLHMPGNSKRKIRRHWLLAGRLTLSKCGAFLTLGGSTALTMVHGALVA